MAEEQRIIELEVGEVDLVEGLWKEMVERHRELTGEDYPVRDGEASWRGRREKYVNWLEGGEGQMFVVPGEGAEGAPLGYAFLRIEPDGPTWDLDGRIGDLESLSVTAAARGRGIGTELIAHCRERLRELGISWWTVTAVSANAGAIDLYEREGFRDFWRSLIAPIE